MAHFLPPELVRRIVKLECPKEVMEDPYDMVENIDQCFVIFPYGLDISMHCIEIIEIISIPNREKILSNDRPSS